MSSFTTRRKFLLVSGAGIAAAALYQGLRQRGSSVSMAFDGPHALLNSIVDTLVPADEFAGALEMGLHKVLQVEIQQRPQLRAQVERLNQAVAKKALAEYHQPFEKLEISERETLLGSLLERTTQRQVRADLSRLRNNVLIKYYSSTQGHASLNYRLPASYPAYQSQATVGYGL